MVPTFQYLHQAFSVCVSVFVCSSSHSYPGCPGPLCHALLFPTTQNGVGLDLC